jgi:hypothetical protein
MLIILRCVREKQDRASAIRVALLDCADSRLAVLPTSSADNIDSDSSEDVKCLTSKERADTGAVPVR